MFFVITVVVFSSKVTFGIIGGQPAPDYPFFVVVNRGFHQCGGTLVRLDAVLTAAHCLYFGAENRWASPLEVYILHGDFSSPNNWRVRYHSCERYWVHFMYEASRKGPRNPYDAAVIKLEDQVLQRSSSQHAILPFCSQDDQKWGKNLVLPLGWVWLRELHSHVLKDWWKQLCKRLIVNDLGLTINRGFFQGITVITFQKNRHWVTVTLVNRWFSRREV